MKILILSDTHIGQRIFRIPKLLFELMDNADYIIHAGDITSIDSLDIFFAYDNFYGVCGNMCDYGVKDSLPSSRIVEIGGYKFGISHGWGSPENLSDRIIERFFNGKQIDFLIYGHSHVPEIVRKGDLTIINPGSFSGNKPGPMSSYAIIELSDGKEPEISIHEFLL